MGFWNKFGKIALTAAPYVAAPFTGGASLALTGAANTAVQKWAQKDAEKAIAKGVAPSKFDKYLGLAGNVAGLASGVGALGGALGTAGTVAKTAGNVGKVSKLSSILGNVNKYGDAAKTAIGAVAQARAGGTPPYIDETGGFSPRSGLGPTSPYDIMSDSPTNGGITGNMPKVGPAPTGGTNRQPQQSGQAEQRDPSRGMFGRNFGMDQNNPNLAPSINMGRMQGMRDTGQLPPSRFQRRLA